MAKLIYAAIASLDGYVEDEQGSFDWAMPDEQLHAFVNELERQEDAVHESQVALFAALDPLEAALRALEQRLAGVEA